MPNFWGESSCGEYRAGVGELAPLNPLESGLGGRGLCDTIFGGGVVERGWRGEC